MAITLEQAQVLIQAAIEKCESMGLRMSFAVVDTKRDLIATARMDGALPFTTDVARGKGMLTILFGKPSGELVELSTRQVFQMVNHMYADKLAFARGAIPVYQGGEIIAAMAASGAKGEEDEEVSIAAVLAAGYGLSP